jgi:hypothetical protein
MDQDIPSLAARSDRVGLWGSIVVAIDLKGREGGCFRGQCGRWMDDDKPTNCARTHTHTHKHPRVRAAAPPVVHQQTSAAVARSNHVHVHMVLTHRAAPALSHRPQTSTTASCLSMCWLCVDPTCPPTHTHSLTLICNAAHTVASAGVSIHPPALYAA